MIKINNATLTLPYLGFFLASPTTHGCQVPQNDLYTKGWSVRGALYLDHSVLRSDPPGLKPLLQGPHRVRLVAAPAHPVIT